MLDNSGILQILEPVDDFVGFQKCEWRGLVGAVAKIRLKPCERRIGQIDTRRAEQFNNLFRPEGASGIDHVGYQEDRCWYLFLVKYRIPMQVVISPAVIEGEGYRKRRQGLACVFFPEPFV